jgi:uncharacterized BrkB/YihY/UPF0761 family membrane protein
MKNDQQLLWKIGEPGTGGRPQGWSQRPRAWWALTKEVWVASSEDDVFGRAAQLGFYFLLAVFPGL